MHNINQQRNDIALSSFSFKSWIKNNKFILFFLLFLVVVAYINALGNDFVSDDRGLLINVPSYTIGNLIGKSYFLRAFQYFLIYQIGGGLNPLLLRLPNILFHIGSVWLIFLLVSRLKNRIVGAISAALFAVHPILVESVSWIAGGVYVEYSFFLLLSFVAYMLSVSSKKWYMISLISFILSLSFSEKAIIFFLIPILYELCFGNLKKNWKKAGFFFIISLVFLFFFVARLGERTASLEADQAFEPTFYNPLFQIPIAITSYLQLIFWPAGLTLYHSEMVFTQFEYILRACFFIGFTVFALYCFKRNRFIFFWLSFFIIALLPTLTPFGIAWVVAERYVYLGSLGIFVVIGLAVQKLAEKKQRRMIIFSVFSLVIMILIVRTIIRNVDWKNEDNLWLSAARTSPSSPQNHNNLGDYYGRHRDLTRSIAEFKKAIALKPNYADAYHNLGNAYREAGRFKEAVQSYQKAASIEPKLWQSHQNMAAIYFAQEKYALAKESLERAISIEPNNTQLKAFLGLAYLKMHNKKAGEIFQQVLQVDPTNQLAAQGLLELQKSDKKN